MTNIYVKKAVPDYVSVGDQYCSFSSTKSCKRLQAGHITASISASILSFVATRHSYLSCGLGASYISNFIIIMWSHIICQKSLDKTCIHV